MTNKALLLLILDGWAEAPNWGGNAISVANTPVYDALIRKYPKTLLQASGEFVGLTKDEVGNSEIGHMNIGSGTIPSNEMARINRSIKDGSFYNNQVLVDAINQSKKRNSAIHLMGIISDGGIHSHINHLYALLKLCKKLEYKTVFIHAFTDGRDTSPMKGIEFVEKINNYIKKEGVGRIATLMGRTYLDRKGNWGKTEVAYKAIVQGVGKHEESGLAAVSDAYRAGETDEYISPRIINGESRVKDDDTIIFFNFRSDRTKQLTQAFLGKNFHFFKRKQLKNIEYVTFIPYGVEKELHVSAKSAFEAIVIDDCLANYFSNNNFKQYHTAETEKYAHVTYFFNGNREQAYKGEDRKLIASPDVSTYAQKPEMSAEKVTNELIKQLNKQAYNFYVCNFANTDMVGHTGVFDATLKAVETVDKMLEKIIQVCVTKEIPVCITGDHGNADEMVDAKTGLPHTQHTGNPVPFVIVSDKHQQLSLRNDGVISNIPATCLEIMELNKPSNFNKSLIISQ